MTEQLVKDYAIMTDEQLDREILIKMGFRSVLDGGYYSIVDANNEPFAGAFMTEDRAWKCVHHLEWATDLNAAIKLWDTIPDDYIPRLVRSLTPKDGVMTFEYKSHIMANDLSSQVEHYATTPARAVCLCWLAWKDAQS